MARVAAGVETIATSLSGCSKRRPILTTRHAGKVIPGLGSLKKHKLRTLYEHKLTVLWPRHAPSLQVLRLALLRAHREREEQRRFDQYASLAVRRWRYMRFRKCNQMMAKFRGVSLTLIVAMRVRKKRIATHRVRQFLEHRRFLHVIQVRGLLHGEWALNSQGILVTRPRSGSGVDSLGVAKGERVRVRVWVWV